MGEREIYDDGWWACGENERCEGDRDGQDGEDDPQGGRLSPQNLHCSNFPSLFQPSMNFDFVIMVESNRTQIWTNIHTYAHCTCKRTIPRHNKAHNCHVFSTSIFAPKIFLHLSTHFTTSPQVNDFLHPILNSPNRKSALRMISKSDAHALSLALREIVK